MQNKGITLNLSKVTKTLKERTEFHHSRICCWGLEIPQHQETETGLLGRKENAQIQNRCTYISVKRNDRKGNCKKEDV